MEQIEFRFLGRLDAPSVVPQELVEKAKSYRDAVRLCWAYRRVKGMKASDLARDYGFTAQHVREYVSERDGQSLRNLPADRIAEFEAICGNTAISQYIAAASQLTVLEQMQADALSRRAA